MRSYLKELAKSVYETVVEDDFLERLTEQEVYFIINKTSSKRLLSHGQDHRKMSVEEKAQKLLEQVEIIGDVAPERELKMISIDCNVNHIK